LDAVVANEGFEGSGTSVGVLLGKGDGGFAPKVEYPSIFPPHAAVLGDLDGDGNLDIVMANIAASAGVLLGTGDGTFAGEMSLYPAGYSPKDIGVGDLDGDGHLDVPVATADGIDVLLGAGDGTLAPRLVYATSAFTLALGDLNRDGRPDLVAGSSGSSAVLLGGCR
jgi:hypothetical protein